MKKLNSILAIAGAMLLAACGNVDSAHFIFGQQQSVGLNISASAPEQGGSLSLGFKDRNIAVIPVVVKNQDGTYTLVGAANKTGPETDINDSYSALGQFELNSGQNGTASVGLGKFFATGIAAQKLADGFKANLSK